MAFENWLRKDVIFMRRIKTQDNVVTYRQLPYRLVKWGTEGGDDDVSYIMPYPIGGEGFEDTREFAVDDQAKIMEIRIVDGHPYPDACAFGGPVAVNTNT